MYIGLGIIAVLAVFAVAEFAYIKYSGTPVAVPQISREEMTIGSGKPLRFAVLGDSTSVAQGGEYSEGYASGTARYLAQQHRITWKNVGVSGARAADVAASQAAQAASFKPDIALIGVGANDVTHLTSIDAVRASLESAIGQLQTASPDIKIILTGSPDMGSPPRIPQPLRWAAGERTKHLNAAIRSLANGQSIIFAPIAERTGPAFRANHGLFAADKFHPNTEGYQLWTPVIIDALR